MRTTISLDDAVLAAAKRRALEGSTTLGQVVEDALRLALASHRKHEAADGRRLPVSSRQGGTRPGVNVHDGARLRDVMDGFDA